MAPHGTGTVDNVVSPTNTQTHADTTEHAFTDTSNNYSPTRAVIRSVWLFVLVDPIPSLFLLTEFLP